MTVEQDWDAVNKALEAFDTRMGISVVANTEASKYMTITQEQMNKMSEEECAEASFMLAQTGMFIQLQLNILQSKIDWCNRKIDRIIAPIVKRELQKYMANELKRAMAVKSDEAASALQAIADEASSYHARLSYLPNSLRLMADKLTEYQKTKRKQNYDN